ncbi:MAG: hypothetical protein HUJ96_07810 [Marinilabiliaceae bacterium]|nr:hypothetical protein [Marinilabiliaceae bacterium]
MNRLILSALGLAAIGFVSCDDETYDNWTKTSEKQTYSQENVIDLGLTATPSFSNVNLADANSGDTYSISMAYSLPANANVSHNIAISQQEEHTSATVYYTAEDNAFSVEGSNIIITADQLQNMVTNAFGKAPETREFYIIDKMVYSISNQFYTAYTTTAKVAVTPTAPVIESKYYFIGESNGWSFANCNDDFLFKRSDDSKSVYDDPVFKVVVPAPKNDDGTRKANYFKIAPLSTIADENWNALLGCEKDGDSSLEGTLINSNAQAMCMPADDGALFYEITLNMMEYTYSVKPVSFDSKFAYFPGDANGWGFENNIIGAVDPSNLNGKYAGYVTLGGEWGWKITNYPTWDKGQFGKGDTEGTIVADGPNIDEGSQAKFYYVELDLAAKTYKRTEVTVISIIGNPDWDTDIDMTFDAATMSWSVTTDLIAASFKFRINHDWALNLGGTPDSLWGDGSDMAISEAGNYTITLYPTYNGNSHCTIKKN